MLHHNFGFLLRSLCHTNETNHRYAENYVILLTIHEKRGGAVEDGQWSCPTECKVIPLVTFSH